MVLLNPEEPVKENAGLRARRQGQGPEKVVKARLKFVRASSPSLRGAAAVSWGTASCWLLSRDLAADFLSFSMMLRVYKGFSEDGKPCRKGETESQTQDSISRIGTVQFS